MSALTTSFRIALLMSVSLNLLLAAALAGLLWRQPPAEPESRLTQARNLPTQRRLEGALPPERRALVREVMGADRASLRSTVQALRERQRRVESLMSQEPLDAAALTLALGEVRRHEEAIAAQVHAGLIRLAAQLNADERSALALHLTERRGHNRDRRQPERPEKLPSADQK